MTVVTPFVDLSREEGGKDAYQSMIETSSGGVTKSIWILVWRRDASTRPATALRDAVNEAIYRMGSGVSEDEKRKIHNDAEAEFRKVIK